MFRTQIYLTEEERKGLHKISDATGKKQSELIREAVDQYIEEEKSKDSRREWVLKEAAGMWADRDDLPDYEELRKSWDRR